MQFLSDLDALAYWPGAQYSQEMFAPSRHTIDAAKSWLRDLYIYAKSIGEWNEPNVTLSPNAEIVFEWWHVSKKLTIYIADQGAEYIKVWGLDIDSDMEEGNAQNVDVRRKLWAWLIG